jgi:hypothetical protein
LTSRTLRLGSISKSTKRTFDRKGNMKKVMMILALSALPTAVFAQGTINSANSPTTLFRTNSLAMGATSGNTANGAPSAGGFLYHLLTAPSTVTSVDASLQGLLSAPWSDAGITMTNATLASGGRINGPSGTVGQTQNWPAGSFQSYIIVGWTANEGTTWAAFAANLFGAQFFANGGNSYWLPGSNGLLINGGFIGASTIQLGAAGDAVGAAPFSLFGSPGPAGTPISTPTTLWLVMIPEPSSFALIGLGGAALIISRRRRYQGTPSTNV